jgi:alpha-galactosidase
LPSRGIERRSVWSLVLVLAASLTPAGVAGRDARPILQIKDAFVMEEDTGDDWTIGNEAIRYRIGRRDGEVRLLGITDSTSGHDWHRTSRPDSAVTASGEPMAIGGPATPFVAAAVSEWHGGVRLDLEYRSVAGGLQLLRSYAVYPGSPVVETWTTFRNGGKRSITLSDLNLYAIAIDNGTLGWISGMGAPEDSGGAFTQMAGALDDGQTVELGSDGRASERTVPWFSVQSGEETFFGALLWSGSWRLRARRTGDTIDAQFGLPPMRTSLRGYALLELPHAVLGFTTAAMHDPGLALQRFIVAGLRQGRPFSSHVTYNTWYSYGTMVDEVSMVAEMELAAAMGIEQFVIDAGWWEDANLSDVGDFTRGWGRWVVDAQRFPHGLAALSNKAHELGMRFGIWVEPERIALATLNRPGAIRERSLATLAGRYEPGVANDQAVSAQICLADAEARQWVDEKLVAFLEEARPDYIKWDNNLWLNCNRYGHGHGTEDGNLAHHLAERALRLSLRERFPDLQIEDCASGGNRLSLGTLGTSDVAWIDDRTAPSFRVRHNAQGLLGLLPAASLLAFVLPGEGEPLSDDPVFDLPLIARSRMLGVLGMSWRSQDLGDGTRAVLAHEIALYKRLRPILDDSAAFLLAPQPVALPEVAWSGWEAVEHVSTRTGDAIVMAFETPDAPSSVVVRLRGLRPEASYEVESANEGVLGTAAGADLMAGGVLLQSSTLSRSHILILRVQ